jgi:hypothetical protein
VTPAQCMGPIRSFWYTLQLVACVVLCLGWLGSIMLSDVVCRVDCFASLPATHYSGPCSGVLSGWSRLSDEVSTADYCASPTQTLGDLPFSGFIWLKLGYCRWSNEVCAVHF